MKEDGTYREITNPKEIAKYWHIERGLDEVKKALESMK